MVKRFEKGEQVELTTEEKKNGITIRNAIGKCPVCKTPKRIKVKFDGGNFFNSKEEFNVRCEWLASPFIRCECGKVFGAKMMNGTLNEGKKCDGRCMSATGPSCDCSCGGENHGANHC